MNKITVLLADDHDIVLEGLRMLLSLEDDMKVISEAKTCREAVEKGFDNTYDIEYASLRGET